MKTIHHIPAADRIASDEIVLMRVLPPEKTRDPHLDTGYLAMRGGKTCAVAWFLEADYPRLVAASADAVPPTYYAFTRYMAQHIEALAVQSIRILPVMIYVHRLVEWCRDQCRPVDCRSRTDYMGSVLPVERRIAALVQHETAA